MSFQAYLDNIQAKTGKTPEEFLALAKAKGLLEPSVKTAEVVDWLRQEYGLGRGHAMALVVVFKNATQPKQSREENISGHFKGDKAKWRATYDRLFDAVSTFGPAVEAWPVDAYISFVSDGKKFAIVQVTGHRLDVGIKLRDTEPSVRLHAAGSWNAMVTHRVHITNPGQVDRELLAWLKQAYASVGARKE